MPVEKELMELLVCPSCHGQVQLQSTGDAEWIVCTACGLKYPVKDDLPVMLIDEAERPA